MQQHDASPMGMEPLEHLACNILGIQPFLVGRGIPARIDVAVAPQHVRRMIGHLAVGRSKQRGPVAEQRAEQHFVRHDLPGLLLGRQAGEQPMMKRMIADRVALLVRL